MKWYILFFALLATLRAHQVYHVPAEVMQSVKYIQNHPRLLQNSFHQQQQQQQQQQDYQQQGYEQQGQQQQGHQQQGYQQQAYNSDLSYQGHQQELNHQFQNRQLQNYQLVPQQVQFSKLALQEIQAPQIQHHIREQIVPQVQPKSHEHQIADPLQSAAYQELEQQIKQIQPQVQSYQNRQSYQIPTQQTHQSNQIQEFHVNSNQGLNYDGQKQGRPEDKSANIVEYNVEKEGPNYRYAYETSNGLKAHEIGTIGKDKKQVEGGYSYKGDNGQTYEIQYIADENGFRAQGAHLPTPPPMPEAIVKALEQNAKDEAAGVFDDGKYQPQNHQQQQIQQQRYDQTTVHQQAVYRQPFVQREPQVHQQQPQADHHQTLQYEVQYQPAQEDRKQYLQLYQQAQVYAQQQDQGYQPEQSQAYVAPANAYATSHQ